MSPKTESEIKNNWKYTNKIYISCICITYNQEGYIENAINGMLSQLTEFKFEIIIYDDVSNDGTKKILEKYKKKYPSIIKIIRPHENQYSKGLRTTFLASDYALGKYIALCEGDDYWINEFKLQKQIIFLEENKDIDLICHNAYAMTTQNTLKKHWEKESGYYSLNDILITEGQFAPTASYFFRREVIEKIPKWIYKESPIADLIIEIFSSLNSKKIYFLNEYLSCYRICSIGSWSSMNRQSINNRLIYLEKLHSVLDKIKIEYEISESINLKLESEYRNTLIMLFSNKNYGLFFKYIRKSQQVKMKLDYKFARQIIKHILPKKMLTILRAYLNRR
ncbi:glycosyltransferase [Providencia stuartii]|uniref:glycosyltransferase n=1 Tax=Providencia stuartii TaxID=588 RepID=UPI003CF4CE80